jgi:hypothetical protein
MPIWHIKEIFPLGYCDHKFYDHSSFSIMFFLSQLYSYSFHNLLDKYSSIIGVQRTMTQIVIHHKMTFVFFFSPNCVPISIGSTCLWMLLNRNLLAC